MDCGFKQGGLEGPRRDGACLNKDLEEVMEQTP